MSEWSFQNAGKLCTRLVRYNKPFSAPRPRILKVYAEALEGFSHPEGLGQHIVLKGTSLKLFPLPCGGQKVLFQDRGGASNSQGLVPEPSGGQILSSWPTSRLPTSHISQVCPLSRPRRPLLPICFLHPHLHAPQFNMVVRLCPLPSLKMKTLQCLPTAARIKSADLRSTLPHPHPMQLFPGPFKPFTPCSPSHSGLL